MIEHMNTIDALNDQIMALLELMMMCNTSTDIRSINMASEMCMTMLDELKGEIDQIFKEWQEDEKKNIS